MNSVCDNDYLEQQISKIDELSDFKLLIDKFSFNSLLNINVFDRDSIRLYIRVLLKIANDDYFYENKQRLKQVLEFVFTKIRHIKNTKFDDIYSLFLELFFNLYNKGKNHQLFIDLIVLKKNLWLALFLDSCRFDCFNETHIKQLSSILFNLLTLDGLFDDEFSQNFDILLNKFNNLRALDEIISLSGLIIEKYDLSSSVVKPFLKWLTLFGVRLTDMSSDNDLKRELFQVFTILFQKYEARPNQTYEEIDEIQKYLSQNFEFVLQSINNKNMRTEAIKTFAYILHKENSELSWDYLNEKLTNLPQDLEQWVTTCDQDLIITIVYLFYFYKNRIIWPHQKILDIISSIIYSFQRFHLTPNMLKRLVYLYPRLMTDNECISRKNAQIGDDLLLLIKQQHVDLSDLFSSDIFKLNWILHRNDSDIKTAFISYWLKQNGDMEILKKIISTSKSFNELINTLIDKKLDEETAEKAVKLIDDLGDKKLKIYLIKLAMKFMNTPQIFNRIMKTNPGIPEEQEVTSKIAEYLALQQYFQSDEESLGFICDYSKKLIKIKTEDNQIVSIFYDNIINTYIMLLRTENMRDVTVLKILGFVTTLVQVCNPTAIQSTRTPIKIDSRFLLSGPIEKISKSLAFIYCITTRNSLVQIDPATTRSLFVKLFAVSEIDELSGKTYKCLAVLLNANHWLANDPTTNLFIQTQCCMKKNEKIWPQFLSFLRLWIKIMKRNIINFDILLLADTEMIRSYLRRVDEIPVSSVNDLLNALDKIDERRKK